MKSKKILFINLTQHKLTDAQVAEAKKLADEIVDVKDFEIYDKIKSSENTLRGLITQTMMVVLWLAPFFMDYKKVYVHLPIGSPAFMFILSSTLLTMPNLYPVFSHTEREVIEETQENGTVIKKNVFRFKGFINFEEKEFIEASDNGKHTD